jgi:restriction endonuclease Mrr
MVATTLHSAFTPAGPDDAGIDGIIKEDKLGLDQIYIQAKRWALEREVKRNEVQRFAGAMNRVKKGVFLTTAKFGERAQEFAKSHEKTISLIDGDALCDLMIIHGVGVAEVKILRLTASRQRLFFVSRLNGHEGIALHRESSRLRALGSYY